jgi:monoamine oxidase
MHFYERVLGLAVFALIVALVPFGAFAMGKGGTGGTGGTGGGGGTGGTPTACTGAVDDPCDVIIVGAGAAGQYAAYELNNLGFDVKVLEARPRRHGMLSVETIGDNPTRVTTIAEGVTGNKSVNWHFKDITNAFGKNYIVPILAEVPESEDALYSIGGLTAMGYDVSKKDFPELYDYWDFYYNWADSYKGPDVGFETYLCEDHGICRDPQHVAFNYYKGTYPGGEWLTQMENIGSRSLAEMEKLWDIGLGEWGHVDSDWAATLDTLYFNTIVDRVKTRSLVTDIDTSGDPVVVKAVEVNCNNCHDMTGADIHKARPPETAPHPRTTYYANAAVVAVALGNLKADDINFVPVLPQWKQDAMDLIGVGNGGKLFLDFSTRFWKLDINVFYADGGLAANAAEGETPQDIGHYCWDYEYRIEPEGEHLIACYLTGEFADNADALGSLDAVVDAILMDLDTMLPGTPFTDNYVDGSAVWKRMDDMMHSRGGYTYPKIGSYPTDGSPSARALMGDPVGTKLYFAGAYTHNEWPSIVVGAMDTGIRVAGEIDAEASRKGGRVYCLRWWGMS